MKNLMIVVATALVALASSAQQSAATARKPMLGPDGKPVRVLNKEKLLAAQMKRFGGFVKDVREQRGKVVVVNAQDAAKVEWLKAVVADFEEMGKYAIETQKGEFKFPKPTVVGEASLFVVDDPALPMSLVAPESRWAMVNIAPLKTEKVAFFEARVKKEMTRGMANLLGAGDSQYPMCLNGCITKAEDLDQFTSTKLPVDLIARIKKYPAGYGITPYKKATYRQSVHDGWGAQPTNEFQKAIWDEIHTLPTKPITIEPEKK